ncbi:hypothetical protein FF011L_12100 [Roseimaritima multifibrata]|uniref:Uncharacterized protein n=1 Tax=Roseimaritima multifibrata TaxID=1930274 RepID=A0A517MCH2_9BACT|nr:SIR2 family protein [Roseimaritima multifibrata]QDS92467.1 hypothetical protein FF011L_12100 [Roseimaritima multifibrata]
MELENGTSDVLQQLDNLLSSSNQSWLFGAGTSIDSGIPLMRALTDRVIARANEAPDGQALAGIQEELDPHCHIEHILSHIADRRAIAERCKNKQVQFGKAKFDLTTLEEFHRRLLCSIAETVRWGYIAYNGEDRPERVGTSHAPIVTIDNQTAFVRAVFNHRQTNVDKRRKPVRIFTTNYDTLIEDALAMECISYWDGFEGGAIGFRSLRFGDDEPVSGIRAQVIKLHGSIDWHLGSDGRVWRVRDSDVYPEKTSRVLIYPQSTKYVATQRDPFASQFDLLRRSLNSTKENVFAICGYSFGDEHINQEIQLAMERRENKTTILAFASKMSGVLNDWANSTWCKRLYVITEKGIFVGGNGPFAQPLKEQTLGWWKLDGVTRLLQSGPEACV